MTADWAEDLDHSDLVDDGEHQDGDADAPPPTYYTTLEDFVEEQVVAVFRRKVGSRQGSAKWAPDWWCYPEAVVRLDALWRAWESLRLDPALGISVWLRDHADYHLNVLMSDTGPFARSDAESNVGDPLPHTRPPAGWWGV